MTRPAASASRSCLNRRQVKTCPLVGSEISDDVDVATALRTVRQSQMVGHGAGRNLGSRRYSTRPRVTSQLRAAARTSGVPLGMEESLLKEWMAAFSTTTVCVEVGQGDIAAEARGLQNACGFRVLWSLRIQSDALPSEPLDVLVLIVAAPPLVGLGLRVPGG